MPVRENKSVSISLGATVCDRDGEFQVSRIRSISKQLAKMGRKFGVSAVVGAGGATKSHVEVASRYTAKRKDLDELGIEASRINAQLLINVLKLENKVRTCTQPFTKIKDVKGFLQSGPGVAILGGLKPGLSSDSTAALISKYLNCPLIIVSTKGAIYRRDPQTSRSKILDLVDRKYLQMIVSSKPTPHVLDFQTSKILLGFRKFSGAVTGYRNIAGTAQSLLYGKKPLRDKSTRIGI